MSIARDVRVVGGTIALAVALCASGAARGGGLVTGLEFRGQAVLPKNLQVGGTTVGGLSSMSYDASTGRYRFLSDDKGASSPRYYEGTIDLADGQLQAGDVQLTGVSVLTRADGTSFPAGAADPEGMALAPDGRLFVSSEGADPFVRQFDPTTGKQLADFALPTKFLPGGGGTVGVRSNQALESLAATPSGRWLYTATEDALIQDGPTATGAAGSLSRILRFDLATGQAGAEFLYQTDPIAGTAGFVSGGLVELLALDDTHLLALERSLAIVGGYSAKLYEVDLGGATDVRSMESVAGVAGLATAHKTLLLDLKTLGLPLWNLEGMTFGPDLADGRRSLILVSDNNFNTLESTQFLAFGLTVVPEPSTASLGVLGALLVVAARLRGVRGRR